MAMLLEVLKTSTPPQSTKRGRLKRYLLIGVSGGEFIFNLHDVFLNYIKKE